MLLNLAIFVFIGATMVTTSYHYSVIDIIIIIFLFIPFWPTLQQPWGYFVDATLGLSLWRLVVLAILILLFRRIPVVVAFTRAIPAIETYREALFSGWFGPIGRYTGEILYRHLEMSLFTGFSR